MKDGRMWHLARGDGALALDEQARLREQPGRAV